MPKCILNRAPDNANRTIRLEHDNTIPGRTVLIEKLGTKDGMYSRVTLL